MPRYGFNFLWMFSKSEQRPEPQPANLRELDLVAEMGLDFVRIPTDYRFWTHDFDYRHPDERVLALIDSYLHACRERGLHMCLNLHRAPGYCINRPELERDNLWLDEVAQDGFIFLWELFARRYQGISSDCLSFDLVNEPAGEGQRGLTRDNHAALVRRTVAAIHAIDPQREVVIDGLGGGHLAMPELADLDVIHSGRGYTPFPISHYQASWCGISEWPEPIYPGLVWDGITWNKEALRNFYQPWRDVEAKGVKVHIGEFGCFQYTPNDVALRWFGDLLSLFREFRWGYSLWNFTGAFGIINHGRPGTQYEDWHGFNVDRALLDLYLENRVTD
ncbi:MAG TPA: cellulase family glycosylhydrolase [Armatimonadota bacterium]|nr:cellulase family glycosylhydrolase [Armatimonadota bacterium]